MKPNAPSILPIKRVLFRFSSFKTVWISLSSSCFSNSSILLYFCDSYLSIASAVVEVPLLFIRDINSLTWSSFLVSISSSFVSSSIDVFSSTGFDLFLSIFMSKYLSIFDLCLLGSNPINVFSSTSLTYK